MKKLAVMIAASLSLPFVSLAKEPPKNAVLGKPFVVKAILSRAGYTSYDRTIVISERAKTCPELMDGKYDEGERLVTFTVDWKRGAKADAKKAELTFKQVGPTKMAETPADTAAVEIVEAPDNRKAPGKVKLTAAGKDSTLQLEGAITQCE